jgi:hypothetical protein
MRVTLCWVSISASSHIQVTLCPALTRRPHQRPRDSCDQSYELQYWL